MMKVTHVVISFVQSVRKVVMWMTTTLTTEKNVQEVAQFRLRVCNPLYKPSFLFIYLYIYYHSLYLFILSIYSFFLFPHYFFNIKKNVALKEKRRFHHHVPTQTLEEETHMKEIPTITSPIMPVMGILQHRAMEISLRTATTIKPATKTTTSLGMVLWVCTHSIRICFCFFTYYYYYNDRYDGKQLA